jgi:hypothetical protein
VESGLLLKIKHHQYCFELQAIFSSFFEMSPSRSGFPILDLKSMIFQGSYLLNVVVAKSATILKLLSGEDQALLVGGDSFLVLDLGLDIVDGVGGLDLKGDGLAREGLDETAKETSISPPLQYLYVVSSC